MGQLVPCLNEPGQLLVSEPEVPGRGACGDNRKQGSKRCSWFDGFVMSWAWAVWIARRSRIDHGSQQGLGRRVGQTGMASSKSRPCPGRRSTSEGCASMRSPSSSATAWSNAARVS